MWSFLSFFSVSPFSNHQKKRAVSLRQTKKRMKRTTREMSPDASFDDLETLQKKPRGVSDTIKDKLIRNGIDCESIGYDYPAQKQLFERLEDGETTSPTIGKWSTVAEIPGVCLFKDNIFMTPISQNTVVCVGYEKKRGSLRYTYKQPETVVVIVLNRDSDDGYSVNLERIEPPLPYKLFEVIHVTGGNRCVSILYFNNEVMKVGIVRFDTQTMKEISREFLVYVPITRTIFSDAYALVYQISPTQIKLLVNGRNPTTIQLNNDVNSSDTRVIFEDFIESFSFLNLKRNKCISYVPYSGNFEHSQVPKSEMWSAFIYSNNKKNNGDLYTYTESLPMQLTSYRPSLSRRMKSTTTHLCSDNRGLFTINGRTEEDTACISILTSPKENTALIMNCETFEITCNGVRPFIKNVVGMCSTNPLALKKENENNTRGSSLVVLTVSGTKNSNDSITSCTYEYHANKTEEDTEWQEAKTDDTLTFYLVSLPKQIQGLVSEKTFSKADDVLLSKSLSSPPHSSSSSSSCDIQNFMRMMLVDVQSMDAKISSSTGKSIPIHKCVLKFRFPKRSFVYENGLDAGVDDVAFEFIDDWTLAILHSLLYLVVPNPDPRTSFTCGLVPLIELIMAEDINICMNDVLDFVLAHDLSVRQSVHLVFMFSLYKDGAFISKITNRLKSPQSAWDLIISSMKTVTSEKERMVLISHYHKFKMA